MTTSAVHLADAAVPARSVADVVGLVEREAPRLLDYFARRVHHREDAADLLGDTLVVVWRRESSIPVDEVHARMWLYGVARKVLSSQRRSSTRRNALAERLRESIAETTTPERDARAHVRSLVATLPAVDREIIGLVYWEGFSLVEVATIMSMPAATVRSRHARARERLRTLLSAED